MIYARVVMETEEERFQQALNEALASLQAEQYIIRDIKFALSSPNAQTYDMPVQALAACIFYEVPHNSGYSGQRVQ